VLPDDGSNELQPKRGEEPHPIEFPSIGIHAQRVPEPGYCEILDLLGRRCLG
jgi:hypothetical protein